MRARGDESGRGGGGEGARGRREGRGGRGRAGGRRAGGARRGGRGVLPEGSGAVGAPAAEPDQRRCRRRSAGAFRGLLLNRPGSSPPAPLSRPATRPAGRPSLWRELRMAPQSPARQLQKPTNTAAPKPRPRQNRAADSNRGLRTNSKARCESDRAPAGRRQGMFGDYAVHALWSDTTAMDSLRYAGAVESVPTTCTASTCYHVPTNYQNNDTDNQARRPRARPRRPDRLRRVAAGVGRINTQMPYAVCAG